MCCLSVKHCRCHLAKRSRTNTARCTPLGTLRKLNKMASGLRPVLLLAALALLLATASGNRRRPRVSPAPDVFTFAWANIAIDKNAGARSCDFVCARWGLGLVTGAASGLCFYTSPAAAGSVYGTWTAAGTGVPPAATDECRGATPAGTPVSNVGEGVSGYSCGCCGVISRRGVAPSCPTNIVQLVASAATCNPLANFQTVAFGNGTRVCQKANGAGALQFGTIDATATNCNIFGPPIVGAPWQRVCMRVNKFP